MEGLVARVEEVLRGLQVLVESKRQGMMVLESSRQSVVEVWSDGSGGQEWDEGVETENDAEREEQELDAGVEKENDEELRVLGLDEGVVMENDEEQGEDIWGVELVCNLE